MKSNSKKLIILVIGLIIAFTLNNTHIDNKAAYTELNFPEQSAGYSESSIFVDGTATGVGAHNWTWAISQPWCYGDGSWSTPYIIENVTIDASSSPTGSGILINNSKSAYFIIRNCTIFNADNSFFDSGIWMENTNNGTIRNNNCSDNNQGIYLIDCEGNNITKNTANDNKYNGIYLDTNCVLNNIMGNIADNNLFGIQLVTNCDNNNITLNTVTSNDDYGIYINSFGASCDNNIILNNTVNENNRYGIFVRYDNNENSIINNSVNDNKERGIYLSSCHDINVTGNSIYSNIRGIYVINCDNGIITGNTINNHLEMGIYLMANSDDNEIRNNTISRNDLGIRLDDSDYNNVTGNTLKDNNWCIYETYCEGNIIEYNDCSPSTVQEPIFIDATDTGVGAHNWTWAESQSWCSGSGTWNDPYILENLKISGFGLENGIEIWNSNVSFIIQDCLIYNSNAGIYLEDVNNSQLINNNCSNIGEGIYLDGVNNNTISGNTANGNNNEGILLIEGDYNYITENTVNDNDHGIRLDSSCDNNIIRGNTANNNNRIGILLQDSNYNNITGNTASGNYYNGIFLDSENNNNIIAGNIFNNNSYGIEIYDGDFNSIIGNTANDNNNYGITIEASNNNTLSGNIVRDNKDTGIDLDEVCDYNVITENIIYNNSLGIYLYSGCSNNSIYKNFFLENGLHAEDDGSDNKWNSTSIGNYWDNHTGPDTTPQDGIVDVSYTHIGGSAGSIDYLPIAEDGAPRITIHAPSAGSSFSSVAPFFNIEVIDDFLFEMWYTIDGGLNNYTFTENGTIDQSAWDALGEGSVTITFYANDIVGNEAFEEVTLTKSFSEEGPDPGGIVIIVVISIVGGVAVISGLYIFMKKRATPE